MDKNISDTNSQSPEIKAEKIILPPKIQDQTGKPLDPTAKAEVFKSLDEKNSINSLSMRSAPFVVKKLTKEDKEKLLEDRHHTPFVVLILKILAFFLLFLTFVSFVWLSLDLSSTNVVLSAFGKPENTEMKFSRLEKQKKFLEDENQKFKSKTRQFESRIENKTYFVYTQTINEIKEGQYKWFNKFDEDGKIQEYGILDGVENIKDYFNSRNYKHPILMAGNNIELENVSSTRDKISFNVRGSNLFGKTFFLNAEFIEMLNSFPFYKNGEIRDFTRIKMENGNDGMKFSLKLDIQKAGEEDTADIRFAEYKNWTETFLREKQGPKIKK